MTGNPLSHNKWPERDSIWLSLISTIAHFILLVAMPLTPCNSAQHLGGVFASR